MSLVEEIDLGAKGEACYHGGNGDASRITFQLSLPFTTVSAFATCRLAHQPFVTGSYSGFPAVQAHLSDAFPHPLSPRILETRICVFVTCSNNAFEKFVT